MHLDEAGPTTFLPTFYFHQANYEQLELFFGSLSDRFEQPGAEHDGIFTRNQTRKA